MCYAVSTGPDPFGPYYRYEFVRPLFPDYPRPAVWPDGYYVPTSTGDEVIQKHACVVERAKMLLGLDATEQCVIIDGVNFLNNADLDGTQLPPPGAPNIMLAAGGSQLKNDLDDDGALAESCGIVLRGVQRSGVSKGGTVCRRRVEKSTWTVGQTHGRTVAPSPDPISTSHL